MPTLDDLLGEAFPPDTRPRFDPGFDPTEEQAHALSLFLTGKGTAIVARAGAGKTSTLRLMAGSVDAPGTYVAFNRAIVLDASRSMPRNVGATTAHSLAFRAVGHRYRARLDAPRQHSGALAQALEIAALDVPKIGGGWKRLAPGFLASHCLRAITRFCQSADPAPGPQHFEYVEGIDEPSPGGARTYTNNNALAEALAPALARAWADQRQERGRLPFTHDHYLKLWQLGDPRIPGEFILFDEAQDAAPVMLAAVEAQERAQLVFVGDPAQQIYEWRGAVDALDHVAAEATAYLRQSFRFGPAIAEEANLLLSIVGPEALVVGTPSIPSQVCPLSTAKAFLTRTNAAAVGHLLAEQAAGRHPHLVGGGMDVILWMRAASDLMRGMPTEHRDLACFDSWGAVQEYVGDDPQGDDLALLVKLADEYGPDQIINAIERMPPEGTADVVVSTAHKAKGREWASVILGDDFPATTSAPELRLAYVALTRAKLLLDTSRCDTVNDLREGAGLFG